MQQNCLTKHHRRPKAQGGSSKKYNISLVRRIDHQEWHVLCDGKLTPEMIALKFSRPERFRPREILAWRNLFGKKRNEVIARYVTFVWLDPAYKLVYTNKTFIAKRQT